MVLTDATCGILIEPVPCWQGRFLSWHWTTPGSPSQGSFWVPVHQRWSRCGQFGLICQTGRSCVSLCFCRSVSLWQSSGLNPTASWPHEHPRALLFPPHSMGEDLSCEEKSGFCSVYLIFMASRHHGILQFLSGKISQVPLGWNLGLTSPTPSPDPGSSSLPRASVPPRRSCCQTRTKKLYSF